MSPFNKKKRYASVAILVTALSTALYAAIIFNPAEQPLVAAGPYELKDFDLAALNNRAYRPWYENGAWQGDLIEYFIDTSGNKSITPGAPVDITPITDTEKADFVAYGNASLDPNVTQTWTARSTFAAKEAGNPYYWQNRNVFTWDGSSKIDFKWDNLVTAGLAGVIDPISAADSTLDGDPWASPTLNYVLGDHTLEKSQPNGTLRSRYNLLGDIVNSNPVYIGPPWETYTDPEFITFKMDSVDGYPDRPGIIAVGANDGMLHVFDETNGAELYAYIPSMLLYKLNALAVVPPYLHTYYVDGRLTAASAKVGISSDWATVLTGGLGAGEKGLFALDVTANDPASHTVLFEKTAANGFGHIYGKPSVLRMPGGTWSVFTGNGLGTGNRAQLLIVSLDNFSVTALNTNEPQAAGLAEPTLVDYNNDQIVDLAFAGDSLGNVWKFDFSTEPVTVTWLYGDGVDNTDQPITAGVEVGEHPNGGYMVYWGTGNVTSFDDAQDANYPPQSVYGIWDQARTGSVIIEQTLGEVVDADFLDGTTVTNTETVRYIATNPLTSGNYQYLCATGDTGCTNLKGWKVELPNNDRLVGGAPQLRAARLTFITTNPIGVNTDPDTGDLDPDLEGDSWLMSLDYLTGGDSIGTERAYANHGVAFNLNRDLVLDEEDYISSVSKPPVGLRLGEGAISQPTLASLGPNVDKMFINGLILPLPQIEPGGPFFNGHIDVVTDSPGIEGGLRAPNNIAYMSQGYNVTINDGLSGTVDGLSHEYDTMHGVNYVDFFDLEPRRGKTSLDGAPFPPLPDPDSPDNLICPANSCEVYTSGDIKCPVESDICTTNEIEGINCGTSASGTLYGCIVVELDAELNRAYDTLTAPRTVTNANVALVDGACPADGSGGLGGRFGYFYDEVDVNGDPLDGTNSLDHCVEWTIDPESETYLMGDMGAEDPIPADKPFIITLANADLSTAGILQIGCRTWGAEEYQDMITRQLEAGVAPASLEDEKYGISSGSLMFTLAEIASGAKDPDGIQCPDDSPLPTLRVSFEQRSILDLGIHGTRSQCVLGLHQPEDKVCYSDAAVLTAAADVGVIGWLNPADPNDPNDPLVTQIIPDDDPTCGGISGTLAHTPPLLPTLPPLSTDPPVPYYLQRPSENWHITWNPNYPGSDSLKGFRWRNGALTLQLLDASGFTLQEPASLLQDKKGKRVGGTFAKAFDAELDANGDPTGVITNRNSKGTDANDVPNESGLLYEAAMFWHYGRLADDIRTVADLGSSGPSSTPCYGGNNYHSRLGIEAKGLNPGEINRIIDKEITQEELIAYALALQAVQNCGDNEQACIDALLALGEMLASDPDLALLDSVREYLPEDFWDDLPPPGAGDDSTPNREVESLDINEDIVPQLIPSMRRSWIDLLN